MKKLTIFLCLMLLSVAVFSSSVYAAFAYDIVNYEQNNGTSTFTDPFSDGDEPPVGPLTSSDYWVQGTFASSRESSGVLELNSADAVPDEDSMMIAAAVSDSSYFFSSGIGGYVGGSFDFSGGLSPDSFFGITMLNFTPDGSPPATDDEAYMGIYRDPSGSSTFAVWGDENNDYQQDITSALGSNTLIAMRLDLTTINGVNAKWDYGDDGSYELPQDNFTTLSFISGDVYTGAFAAGEPIPEPTTLLLLGSGLLGIVLRKRRK